MEQERRDREGESAKEIEQEDHALDRKNPAQAGHAADAVGPQESQSMTLVIRTSKETIEVPLRGKLIVENSGQAPVVAKSKEEKKEEDREFLKEMRGWLVTVATLFVSMAYQAAMQPPAWMPKTEEWSRVFGNKKRELALSPDERKLVRRAFAYQTLNTITFSIALTIVVMLLAMDKSSPSPVLRHVTGLATLLSLFVATNFLVGITYYGVVTAFFSFAMVLYAAMLAFMFWRTLRRHLPAPKARSDGKSGATHD